MGASERFHVVIARSRSFLGKRCRLYVFFERPRHFVIMRRKEARMIIGDRLRELREAKKLSQGDIEKRTGLLRCYISRVENGHTVPAIETLEKLARAFEVPLYQLFYEGDEPPKLPNLLRRKTSDDIVWGSSGKQAVYLHKLEKMLEQSGGCRPEASHGRWRKKWPLAAVVVPVTA